MILFGHQYSVNVVQVFTGHVYVYVCHVFVYVLETNLTSCIAAKVDMKEVFSDVTICWWSMVCCGPSWDNCKVVGCGVVVGLDGFVGWVWL